MKALYLHPGMNKDSSEYCIIPMGAIGLVNLLRNQGWEVSGLNLPLELSLDPNFDLVSSLKKLMPVDIVLIDLHWYMHSAGAIQAAETVKSLSKDCFIVVGGMTASYFDFEIMEKCPAIDLIIRGDAEDALIQVADSLKREKTDFSKIGNITYRNNECITRTNFHYKTDHELFNKIDYVSIDWLRHYSEYYKTDINGFSDKQSKRYWLEVGRGCFFNCGMCGGGLYAHREISERHKPMFRSVTKILEDLERLQDLGVEQVAFSHDIFALNFPGLNSLIDGMKLKDIKLGLLHEYWRLPKKEVIDLVYKSFDPTRSAVAISAESGDEMIRKRNFPSKFFSNAELLSCLKHLSNYDQDLEVFFAANLPWESTVSWEKAITLMNDIVKVYPQKQLIAYSGFLTLDPLSPMWNNPEGYEIDLLFNCFNDYFKMTESGRRVSGYTSSHLSPMGVVQNLNRFKEAMIGIREGQRQSIIKGAIPVMK